PTVLYTLSLHDALPICAIYESFTATHNSLYSVQVTENGCTVSSDCVAVGSVGLYEEEMNNSWNVFPNPTENMITIEYNTLTPSSDRKSTRLNSSQVKSS